MKLNHILSGLLSFEKKWWGFACLGFWLLCVPNGYSQIQKWSDATSWESGKVPGSLDAVVIPKGKEILLDLSPPPLQSITVMGTLVFEEKDISLVSGWIFVDGGMLQIGNPSSPYRAKANITLVGTESPPHKEFGNTFLGIANGGKLSLHGISAKKESWSPIDVTALPNDETLFFDRSLSWQEGDEIVITSSSYDPRESEKLTIAKVDAHRVHISPKISYIHWGRKGVQDGQEIDERSEVALLSRNILIQADEASQSLKKGFRIVVKGKASLQVEGAEFRNLGVASLEDGYGLYWKYKGPVSGSYIRNSSIHRSFNRAVVLEGISDMVVAHNVLYNLSGNAVSLIQAEGNELLSNVGAVVQRYNQRRSSVFYLDNLNNKVVGNRAIGAIEGNGFELKIDEVKEAENFSKQFFNNVSHTNNTASKDLAFDIAQTRGNGFLFYQQGQKPSKEAHSLHLSQMSSFKNSTSGLHSNIEGLKVSQSIFTGNAIGIICRNTEFSKAFIRYATENEQGRPLDFGTEGGGVHFTALGEEGIKLGLTGLNISGQPTAGIVIDHERVEPISAAYGLKLSQDVPIRFGNLIYGALIDLDGSLTGKPGVLVGSDPGLITPNCTYLHTYGAYTCSLDEYIYMEMEDGSGAEMKEYDLIGASGTNALSGKIGNKSTSFVIADKSYLLNIKGTVPKDMLFRFEGVPGKTLVLQIPYDKKTGFWLEDESQLIAPVDDFEALKGTQTTYLAEAEQRVLYVKIHLGQNRRKLIKIHKGNPPESRTAGL